MGYTMSKSLISCSVHIIIKVLFEITVTERNAKMLFPGLNVIHTVCVSQGNGLVP